MKFHTTLVTSGKSATGIRVPDEIVDALGGGRKPPVTVTINGLHTYRTSIAVMGGVYMMPVSAENRLLASVEGGDEADIEVVLDTEPRVLEIPVDLLEALEANPAAREYFDTLSYSNKRRHTLAIDAAKAADTRARRVEKAVALFAEGKN